MTKLLSVPRLLAAAYGLLATLMLIGAERPPVIPVEQFFAEPDIRSVEVAPDGKHLAFLTTFASGKVGIALMKLETGKVEPLVDAPDENIDFFIWKGPDRIVYAGDLGGNESPAYRSISISKRHVLALAESYRDRYSDKANWASIVDPLPYDPRHMLIYGPKEIGSYKSDLYLLDVANANRKLVPVNTHGIDSADYVVDNAGAVRARSRLLGEKSLFEVRRDASSDWTKVAEFTAKDPLWNFLYFAADNQTLYFLTRENGERWELRSLDCSTGKISDSLFRPTEGEISSFEVSYDRSKLRGVLVETDKEHYHWFDPARAQLQAQIDSSLPNTVNRVVSRTPDEQLLVILADSDRDPGTYYLLDRRAPRLMALGRRSRYLAAAQMQPMEPVSFKARDGLILHGYLTRAAGSTGQPTPLVINPHGGPYGVRDSWGFNTEVQFLANRGYSVLQVNYRGSGGYGQTFHEAGKREWGGKMQDDLTDAVKWAIEQKIADPAHIAIYGGSYGGYAALAGAAFTPDLYRCAVNYVGVSDLNLITSWGRGRFGRGDDEYYREWVGDDKQYKADHSPVNFVDRIKIPILNAYGFNDPRVEIDHWKRLEPKLKQFGKTYEIIIEKDEGHGFRHEKARIEFYRRLEAFLAKYL